MVIWVQSKTQMLSCCELQVCVREEVVWQGRRGTINTVGSSSSAMCWRLE
jgi:hypothetical protein